MTPERHSGLKCTLCGDVIFSMSVHDFKSCKCGSCFVDGGFDYLRYGYKNLDEIEHVFLDEYVPEGLTKRTKKSIIKKLPRITL